MKFVLKRQEKVKLFTEKLTYDALISFIEREFDVQSSSIQITFTDEDGDKIMIASQEDVPIVQSYFDGKNYVKLDVKGQKNVKSVAEDDQVNLRNNEKDQIIEPVKKKKKKEKAKTDEKPPKQAVKQKKQKKVNDKKSEKKTAQIKKLLNLAVIQLVDERLKAMMPCMRQQLSQKIEAEKVNKQQLINEGFQCSMCLKDPIIGIRYECPTCQRYQVCTVCQQNTQHQHNLLKIRHLNPAKKQKNHIDKLCKLILEGKQKGNSKKADEALKKQQQRKALEAAKVKSMKRYLSQLFGNEPKFYHDFVKKNKKLSLQELVRLYSSIIPVSDEQLYQKVVTLQCQRLSKKFSKQADIYRNFVKENFNFDFDVILKLVYEKGVQRKEKKEPLPQLPIKENIEHAEEKQNSKEEVKPVLIKQQEPIIPKTQKVVDEKIVKEVIQLKGQKQEILNLMTEFFGETRKKQYVKFIEENQKFCKQDIVQMWADRHSIIQP